MIFRNLLQKKAVTMTELLVVLAIVTLLATMAVPVYVNQLNRAKVATAQAETNEISKAMQAVAITHGFLVPIHILDNVPKRDATGIGGSNSALDDMQDSNINGRKVIDVNIPLRDQDSAADQFNLDDNNPRILGMVEGWQGPFLNPKRVRYVGATDSNPFSGDIDKDLVVDPWGNPYRVYAPTGVLGSESPQSQSFITNNNLSLNFDDLSAASTVEQDRFDRYAIVSYGPNGETDFLSDPLDQGDDLFSTFVINTGNESRYQFY